MIHPVLPGITCGSGPGHLALFGYDPLEYRVGRGVFSALGADFDLKKGDVAARGNFCTVDEQGIISDRRAGRISDDEGKSLVDKLSQIELHGAELFVEHVKQYRFVVIFRSEGLSANLRDSDPHRTGVVPAEPVPTAEDSQRTASLANRFIEEAGKILRDEQPANMVLLRGFSSLPEIPSMHDAYGVDACAVASYPMYRGFAQLVGMKVSEAVATLPQQVGQLREAWKKHDFFFLHFKDTDSAGEDGDFDRKVQCIEQLDEQVTEIMKLNPQVLIVTGDHSTPSRLRSHSWHPVPILLSADTCRPDRSESFGEREAMHGGLGQFEATYVMPLALAHAGRLDKFGA